MRKIEFLEKARDIHGYKYNYINLNDKLILSDHIDVEYMKKIYKQRVSKHLLGKCPEKNIAMKSTDEFINEAKEIWGNKYNYTLTIYKGALIDVEIIYDGIIYKQRPTSHLSGMAPEFRKNEESIINEKMKKSDFFGETRIYNFLKKNNIEFKQNYKLDEVTFDFYIVSTRTCIEFDGRQHYEPIDVFGGIDTFNKLKKTENESGKKVYTPKVKDIEIQMVNSFIEKAQKALANKDYESSYLNFERVYRLSKMDTAFLYNAAVLATQNKSYDKALSYYDELKELGYTGISTEYYATNTATNTEESFPSKLLRDAAVKGNSHSNARNAKSKSSVGEMAKNIAIIYIERGENEKAIQAIEEAKAEDPNNAENVTARHDFYLYIIQHDKRNGTNFKETFPELNEFIDRCQREYEESQRAIELEVKETSE